MKYLIFGAGAIGTYIGGSLLKAGRDVRFIDRIEAIPDLLVNGISLRADEHTYNNRDVKVFSDPGQAFAESIDVVVFAMKSFDTLTAARTISTFNDKFKVVLCIQNGVENEQVIAEEIGWDKVIGGTVTSSIGRLGLGNVVLERKRGIGILHKGDISQQIYRDFQDADLNPILFDSLPNMKWSKMLSNLLGNASCAILDMTPTEVFSSKSIYKLEVDQIKEALRVMKANGWKTVNLPGVPMQALIYVISLLPTPISQLILKNKLGGGRGAKMPSFHIDLHSGKTQSEVVYLNGAVERFGEKVGVPTPVNSTFMRVLLSLVDQPQMIEEYRKNPQLLIDSIRQTQ